MNRLLPLSWIALAAVLLLPSPAHATIRPVGVKIRWLGDLPAPAKAGQDLAGRFEIVAAASGIVENVTVEGARWSPKSLDAPSRMMLSRGDRREFSFRATPGDEKEPLVVSCTFNGQPVRKRFRLDAASLEKASRPRRVAFADGPPRLAPVPKGARTEAQTITFTGRFTYMRGDAVELGADNIVVRIMDDDSPDPFDDVIWEGTTDLNGNFGVTVNWDDSDDPDIYVEFIAGSSQVDVQTDDIFERTYSWSSEDQVIDDYTGNFIAFGTMQPGDPGEHGAPHIYSSLTKSWRYSAQHAMTPPLVDAQWPDDDGTFYNPFFQEIHIEGDETWREGTHAHEFGHHLNEIYGNMLASDYDNGYCDFPTPSHCVWCPENLSDAWQEGWANWFASFVVRSYPGTYGILAYSRNDTRYILEDPDKCVQDSLPYPSGITEGFIGALLRDIEDSQNDDHDGGALDCDIDAMGIGDAAIMTVFRDDDPTDIFQFINSFRLRYNQYDQDLWSTTRNVWTGFGFPITPPIVTSQPEDCQIARVGETVVLEARGNGSQLKYQWRKDGVNVVDGGGFLGAQLGKLFLSPATASMSGTYQCVVSTCDGTYSTFSLPSRITIQSVIPAATLLSWGENGTGQVGNGAQTFWEPPVVHPIPIDMVAADGGRSFTIALRADGTVYSWGQGTYGELGQNFGVNQQNSPAPIPGLGGVLQIATGFTHALALDRDGAGERASLR